MFWDIVPEICLSILWHQNVIGGLRNLFKYSRGAMKFSSHQRVIMKCLPSWNISSCPSPQYLLTPIPHIISSIFYIIEQGQKSGSVIIVVMWCVVVDQVAIGYFLDNNYMYHMTKCNLLLVVCRSWNHNIDAGLRIAKVLM